MEQDIHVHVQAEPRQYSAGSEWHNAACGHSNWYCAAVASDSYHTDSAFLLWKGRWGGLHMAVFQVSKPTMYFELCNITYNIIQVLKIHAQAALMGS